MTTPIKLFPGQKVRVTESFTKFATDWMPLHRDRVDGTLTAVWISSRGSGRWNFPNDEFVASNYPGLVFEFENDYTRCETVGDLT